MLKEMGVKPKCITSDLFFISVCTCMCACMCALGGLSYFLFTCLNSFYYKPCCFKQLDYNAEDEQVIVYHIKQKVLR